jgi:DNA helicase II / ATP-dependent DNA helicase PcrA
MASFKWSAMQEAIFDDVRNGTGHTCVEALAGTAKSTSLIESLKHVPKSAASSILVTSFSTACVEDLKKKNPPWMVDVRSLNSLGFKALRDNGYKDLKVDKDRAWNILDDLMPIPERISAENRRGFNAVRSAAKSLVDLAKGHLAEDSESMYELCDEFGIVDEVPDWLAPSLQQRFGVEPGGEMLGIVFAVLETTKNIDNGIVDFNDQMWLPIVYGMEFESYERLMVDEAQDLSPVQMEMLYRSISDKTGRVCMYGDDNQAIFAWRGAGMGMAPFADKLNAKRLPLSVSYRCPKAVIDLAHRCVPQIEAAPDAPEGVVDRIDYTAMLKNVKLNDTVLSRSNAPLVRLFLSLLKQKIPVGMKGRDLGAQLTSFITKFDVKTVDGLRAATVEWVEKESKRRLRNDPDADLSAVTDKAESVYVLCDHATTMPGVFEVLEKLLTPPSGAKVLLSSVHRGKGLEWDRVFMLDYTFPINPSFWMQFAKGSNQEEWAEGMANKTFETETEQRNIFYVACTRSRRELYLVEAP